MAGSRNNSQAFVSPQVLERIKAIQSTVIVKPILEYLRTYGLEGVVSFIYHGAFMDVDILSPKFDSGLSEKEADLETIASLLIKHNIEVPSDLRIQQHAVQKRKELRSAIKCFENWLIGHLIYADLEGLSLDSVYYSPRVGILVRFVGYDSVEDDRQSIPINKYLNDKDTDIPYKKEIKPKEPSRRKAWDYAPKTPLDEWKKNNPGYQWVKEQLEAGRARKDIILEFNKRHKIDPENYSTREGKELSAAIMSHWARMINQELLMENKR